MCGLIAAAITLVIAAVVLGSGMYVLAFVVVFPLGIVLGALFGAVFQVIMRQFGWMVGGNLGGAVATVGYFVYAMVLG